MSDLHLEFAPYEPDLAGIDLVLLAGDIHCPGTLAVDWARRLGVPSILVMGNHEGYGQDLMNQRSLMADAAENSACTFLDDDVHIINKGKRKLRILGSTLWTDFKLLGEAPAQVRDAIDAGRAQLNDFRLIRNGPGRRLTPQDTIEMHELSIEFLAWQLADPFDGDTIVMTHHAPTPFSSAQQHIGSALSPCFASNLDDFVASSGARLWVHGHTHSNADMTLGRTRLVARQRGYPGEPTFACFEPLIIEI